MSFIAFVWTGVLWVWDKCPWWLKIPTLITIGPNLVVNTVLFYFFLVPYISSQFTAMARPMKEQRDIQIAHHLEMENLKYNIIREELKEFRQQQSLMYQAQLDIASRLPPR